jgi:AraC family transcriptional regulator, transcriptional activator for feuABC-ybbA operon
MINKLQNNHSQIEVELDWNHYFYRIKDINRVKTFDVPPRLTNTFELLIVIDGKGKMTLGHESFLLHAQDVCIIEPAQVYTIQTSHHESIEYILCKFTILSDKEIQKPSFHSSSEKQPFYLIGKHSLGNFSNVLEITDMLCLLKNSVRSQDLFHMRILFEQLIFFIIQNKYTTNERPLLW